MTSINGFLPAKLQKKQIEPEKVDFPFKNNQQEEQQITTIKKEEETELIHDNKSESDTSYIENNIAECLLDAITRMESSIKELHSSIDIILEKLNKQQ